jgi:hypothetical protein
MRCWRVSRCSSAIPTGFDFPELIDKLFLPEAARKVRAAADAGSTAEEFTAPRRCTKSPRC